MKSFVMEVENLREKGEWQQFTLFARGEINYFHQLVCVTADETYISRTLFTRQHYCHIQLICNTFVGFIY